MQCRVALAQFLVPLKTAILVCGCDRGGECHGLALIDGFCGLVDTDDCLGEDVGKSDEMCAACAACVVEGRVTMSVTVLAWPLRRSPLPTLKRDCQVGSCHVARRATEMVPLLAQAHLHVSSCRVPRDVGSVRWQSPINSRALAAGLATWPSSGHTLQPRARFAEPFAFRRLPGLIFEMRVRAQRLGRLCRSFYVASNRFAIYAVRSASADTLWEGGESLLGQHFVFTTDICIFGAPWRKPSSIAANVSEIMSLAQCCWWNRDHISIQGKLTPHAHAHGQRLPVPTG